MADYQYKYLRVQTKSNKFTIKRIDVGHLNKKGRELEWDKLNKEFPSSEYITCYEESQKPLYVFGDTKEQAKAVKNDVQLIGNKILSMADLEKMNEDELKSRKK